MLIVLMMKPVMSRMRICAARPPMNLPNARDVSGARQLARELVGRFGELVEAWPALVESARRLRANGSRVSDPV